MSKVKDFERALEKMWCCRKDDLIRLICLRRGRPQEPLSRQNREKQIEKLQDLAEKILFHRGKDELRKMTSPQRLRIKGYSRRRSALDERWDRIIAWTNTHAPGSFVYCFHRNGDCLYVGRSRSSGKRFIPYKQAKSILAQEATQLKVYPVRKKSQLAKAECLAIHLFNPDGNDRAAAHEKYSKECRICCIKEQVRQKVEDFFKLR